MKPLPADDLSTPGWTIRQGQAVWKTPDSDLAGELILATHTDGRSSVQFIKTPLPLVSAQWRSDRWTIRFITDNRTISGRGIPPAQLLWLHLVPALRGHPPRKRLQFTIQGAGNWELRSPKRRESISGYLQP